MKKFNFFFLPLFFLISLIQFSVYAGGTNRCCDHEDRKCCCRGPNNEQILIRDRHEGYFQQYHQGYNQGYNNYNGFNTFNRGLRCVHHDGKVLIFFDNFYVYYIILSFVHFRM